MRLLCPNCDAQYEVDKSVIPSGGRDVQCSSCGQTWFQKSAAQLEEEGVFVDEIESTPPEAPAEEPAEPEVEAVVQSEAEPEQEPDQEPDAEETPESDPEIRKPDEAVLDILREEAAHESDARNSEAQDGLETQPDLGLDNAGDGDSTQMAGALERTARLRGIEPEVDKSAARRDLLPDIEEINSTLRASSETDGISDTEDTVAQKSGGRGFRFGFGLVIVLATFLLLAYIYAPQIVEKFPSSEGFMSSYVDKVNDLRTWLDHLMKTATEKMSGGTNTDS